MLITIITVVYNAVETIEETILSIINQDFKDFEYIIIDGGSDDGTAEILKKYKNRLAYWVSEKDNGIYDAMNKGVLKANGNWIFFLGADDILFSPDVLQNVSGNLISNNTIYYGNVLFKHRNIIYDGKFNSFKLATRNLAHQSIFYPKKVFDLYKFKLIYTIFADYDLNIILFNNINFIFKYLPLTIAVFDDFGSSGSRVPDSNFERNRLSIIKKNFPFYVFLYRFFRSIAAKLTSRL
jgi:glycosyltransferase involved in cell wall biosynthesis